MMANVIINICFVLCALICRSETATVEFQLQSNYVSPLWVGIQGLNGYPHLENGGVELSPGNHVLIKAEDDWQGSFWPRTGCDEYGCETGDCCDIGLQCKGCGGNPPISRALISLRAMNNIDLYEVNLGEGYNIPITLEPLGGQNACKKIACTHDFKKDCPTEFQVIFDGRIVGCKLTEDNYDYFKSRCPDAYCSQSNDNGTFSCLQASGYKITFGL